MANITKEDWDSFVDKIMSMYQHMTGDITLCNLSYDDVTKGAVILASQANALQDALTDVMQYYVEDACNSHNQTDKTTHDSTVKSSYSSCSSNNTTVKSSNNSTVKKAYYGYA